MRVDQENDHAFLVGLEDVLRVVWLVILIVVIVHHLLRMLGAIFRTQQRLLAE